jgi:AbrB family looped-hinge helix DNA binding protein
MKNDLTRISSKGQVVIPQHIRNRIGLREGQPLAVSAQDGLIVLKKLDNEMTADDLRTLREIKDAWKDIAQGRARRMSSSDFLKEIAEW